MLVRKEQSDKDPEYPAQQEDEPITTLAPRLDHQLLDFCIAKFRTKPFLIGFGVSTTNFVGADLVLARAAAEHCRPTPSNRKEGEPDLERAIDWKIPI